MSNLALFDFDGTVSNRDSFLHFIQTTVGTGHFFSGMAMLTPQVFCYLVKIYPNYRLKEAVLRHFFGQLPLADFEQMGFRYVRTKLPSILRPRALQRIRWHQERKDTVVIVSASPELTIGDWCRTNELDLLATRLEVINERLTGQIQGANCWGEEKVRRVKEKYCLADFNDIYVYGDSRGDLPLLNIASQPFYKPFH